MVAALPQIARLIIMLFITFHVKHGIWPLTEATHASMWIKLYISCRQFVDIVADGNFRSSYARKFLPPPNAGSACVKAAPICI